MQQLQSKLMQLEQSYNRSKQALYAKELTLISKKKIVKLDEENSSQLCKICEYCQSILWQFYCKVQTQSYSNRVKLCVKCTYQLLTHAACNCEISSSMPYSDKEQQEPSEKGQVNRSNGTINLKDFTNEFSEMPSLESQAQFSNFQESQPESQITNKHLKQFAKTLAGQVQQDQSTLPTSPLHLPSQQSSNDPILSRLYEMHQNKSRLPQMIKLKVMISILELTYENLIPKHEFEAKLMTIFCERVLSRVICKTYSQNDVIAKRELLLIYNCWIEKAKHYLKDQKNMILRECPNRDSTFFKKFTAADAQFSAVNEANKKSRYFHGLIKNPSNWNRLILRLQNGQYDYSQLFFAIEPAKFSKPRIRMPK